MVESCLFCLLCSVWHITPTLQNHNQRRYSPIYAFIISWTRSGTVSWAQTGREEINCGKRRKSSGLGQRVQALHEFTATDVEHCKNIYVKCTKIKICVGFRTTNTNTMHYRTSHICTAGLALGLQVELLALLTLLWVCCAELESYIRCIHTQIWMSGGFSKLQGVCAADILTRRGRPHKGFQPNAQKRVEVEILIRTCSHTFLNVIP